ncbi:MAG: hypothetical protein KGM15_01395 [Pseudomonadota bacterium]|nr:hypothetical protein [Pseudomonadota bacterium]
MLEILALMCAAATIMLALTAIGVAIAPFTGAAWAFGVEAGLVAAMGLSTFAWARAAAAKPRQASVENTSVLPLAQIEAMLTQSLGLSIVAGLVLGALAGGRRPWRSKYFPSLVMAVRRLHFVRTIPVRQAERRASSVRPGSCPKARHANDP